MSSSSRRAVPLLVAVLLAAALATSAEKESPCSQAIYVGFDSRLEPRIVGRLPEGSDAVQGFELFLRSPVVALPHRLLAYKEGRVAAIPSLDRVVGLTVDASGVVRFETERGIRRLGSQGLEPDPGLNSVVAGRLYNSGNEAFLEVLAEPTSSRFLARRTNGAAQRIAEVPGKLRAVSWNSLGLSAVIEDSLLAWEPRTAAIVRLAADSGLRTARDVCLAGHERAIVALGHSVVLITKDSQIVVALFPARCRWDVTGILYLLDERSGVIWSVEGLGRMGVRNSDLDHARQLVESLPANAPETSPAFLEASRIVGCKEARRWRNGK